jgi:hypothetical protein
MRERDHLRALSVRVPGHERGAMLLGAPREHLLQRGDGEHQVPARALGVETQVGGHLVVAAAPGVQPSGNVANSLEEASLDGRVDVLVAALEDELVALEVAADLAQRRLEGARVAGRDQPHLAEHMEIDPSTSSA